MLPWVALIVTAATAQQPQIGAYGATDGEHVEFDASANGTSVLSVGDTSFARSVDREVPMTRIHFTSVVGALEGDKLNITATDGTRLAQIDLKEPPFNRSSFWTVNLPGTAFYIHPKLARGSSLKFTVDKLLLPTNPVEKESVIVRDDNVPIYALPSNDPARKWARSVVRLSIAPVEGASAGGRCTGFMITADEVLTNAHCVNTDDQCDKTLVEFGVADKAENEPVEPVEQITCGSIVGYPSWSDHPEEPAILDFVVLKLIHKTKADWGRLKLATLPACEPGKTTRCLGKNGLVLIHQYKGLGQQVSHEVCAVSGDAKTSMPLVGPKRFGHTCATSLMSSGSPLIDPEKAEVVGLHFAGAANDYCKGCFNMATQLASIVAKFATWSPAKQPDF